MCLSVPAKIIEIIGDSARPQARVDHGGNVLVVDTSMIDNPAIGDYILLHAGIALDKYDPDEVQETLALHEELDRIRAELDAEEGKA